MKEFLDKLVGLEVVDVYENEDGSFGILFDDGYIVYAPVDHEVMVAEGRGWEELWNKLKE